MALCATTALAGAVPWSCVCGACGRLGGVGPVPVVVSSLFPPARPAFPALCVAGRPVWASLILARRYAIPYGLCVPWARSVPLRMSGLGPVLFLACFGGGGGGPVSPYLAWGCALLMGWMRAWGPVTNPTTRALVSWPCALAWRAVGAARERPGGALLAWVQGARDRALSHPSHLSFRACGRGRIPTACGCGGCGRGDPSPTPQRALLRAGFARCGSGMKVPGGGASCLGVGRPGSGALPPPTTRPFGRAAGAHYPVAVGAGDAGVGTRQQPHSTRSCELALRAVGAA